MPAKPSPKASETVNRPTSSVVSRNAVIARIWKDDPTSTVMSPPMWSENQPQNWRLMKPAPSSTDSMAAPCDGRMPRSLQNAGRCACGIAIGMQHSIIATAISA